VSSFSLFLRPNGADDVGRLVADWLVDRGHEVRLLADSAAAIDRGSLASTSTEFVRGADLMVSLGGDGTMLRAAALASVEDVPVLGVNLGDLGYLTAVEPDGAIVALKRFLAGSYEIEERMRLSVEVSGQTGLPSALNEIVIEKAGTGQTVRLDVSLDGEIFTSYVADGLILATPTGSTAYSFSSRGPILDPELRAIVTTPVAAHMLFDRSMVLSADCQVSAVVAGDRGAQVSIDGSAVCEIAPGGSLTCRGADRATRLVTFANRNFHQVLRSKLALEDR
jgi:NAD+ kinase